MEMYLNQKNQGNTGYPDAIDVIRPKTKDYTRVRDALGSIKEYRLLNKIQNCKRGQHCGSIYCNECRKRAVKRMGQTFYDYYEEELQLNEEEARKRLRFVTILNEVVRFQQKDIKDAVSRTRKVLNKIRRDFPDIWIRGAFEIELIDLGMVCSKKPQCPVKAEIVRCMSDLPREDYPDSAEGVFVCCMIHFHAVMDIGPHDASDIKTWFAKKWNKHSRQTWIEHLYNKYTVEQSLENLASYLFKNRMAYNYTMETDGFRYAPTFSYGRLGQLIKCYDSLGRKGYKSQLINVG